MPAPFLNRWRAVTLAPEAGGTTPSDWTLIDSANDASGTGTTLTLTVPAGGVASGQLVVVAVAYEDHADAATVADSGLNTYNADASARNASGTRTMVLSSVLGTGLAEAESLTLTFPSGLVRAAAAYQVTDAAGGAETAATATGNSSAPSSGSASLSAAGLVVGAIGTLEAQPVMGTQNFTAGSGWTEDANEEAAGASNVVTLLVEHRLESGSGSFAADGTLLRDATPGARQWAAAAVPYVGG